MVLFRQVSGSFMVLFRQVSGSFMVLFRQVSGSFMVPFRQVFIKNITFGFLFMNHTTPFEICRHILCMILKIFDSFCLDITSSIGHDHFSFSLE
jgi:hypothetical protein